jgi:hypothetical protein
MNQYPNQDPQPQNPYPTVQGPTPSQPNIGSVPQPDHNPTPGYGEQQPQYNPGSGYPQQQSQTPFQTTGYPQQQQSYQPGGYQQQQVPFQQGDYQQGSYQQSNYQQAPYQQTPYPNKQALNINLDYRNIIIAVGGLLSFIAFFLAYYSAGYDYYHYTESGADLARGNGRFWFDMLFALAAILIAVLLQFGDQWFKSGTSSFVERLAHNKRLWVNIIIGIGVYGILVHVFNIGNIGYWGIGAWLYLLGMIAVLVGGIFFIRPPTPSVQAVR